MATHCPKCGQEYKTSAMAYCCISMVTTANDSTSAVPQSINALAYLAGICQDALTSVRLDPAWHTALSEDTKRGVAKALRLIGG